MSTLKEDIQEYLDDQDESIAIRRKLKRKIIYRAVVITVAGLVLLVCWLYGYNAAKNSADKQIEELRNQIAELEEKPVVIEPIRPEIVQAVISSKIAEISELATMEYIFTNAAKFTDTAHIIAIFDWMTEKSFVQKWDGRIKAGVKLENVSVEVENGVIRITVPRAEILSYEIDYDSVEVLDEKNNIFNPISVNDKTDFDKETAEAMKQRAVENGLLEKAQKSAENIIANLLTATLENVQEYTIEFVVLEEK